MAIFKKLFFCCITLWTSLSLATTSNDLTIHHKLTAFMQEHHIPGMAVILYREGKPHTYYLGHANQHKKIPVSKQTIFEIGSISKVMTSLLLAQAVDSAKVQLNDPINKPLNINSEEFDDITFLDLATHTAGLPFKAPETIHTSADLSNYLSHLKIDQPPQAIWQYSNISMGLLGMALEKATHTSYAALLQKNVFSPLRMTNSGVQVTSRSKKFLAQGYNKNNQPTPLSAPGLFPSAWAVKSSADDMQRFLSAAIGLPGTPEKILYPMRLTQTGFIDVEDHFQGLGWHIYLLSNDNKAGLLEEDTSNSLISLKVTDVPEKPIYDSNALIEKTGATEGFRSYIAVIPQQESGIVILANHYLPHGALAQLGRQLLLG